MNGLLPCLEWSPPEGSALQTWNLELSLNSQNLHHVRMAIDCHLPCLGLSPTNPRMVTHQKEAYYRHGIWQIHITHKTNTRWQLPWMVPYHSCEGHPQTQGWSPTNPRMVIPFGPAWPYLTPSGLGCPCLAKFGPVWPHFVLFGPIWPVWPHLAPFDLVLTCLTLSGPICPCLALFGIPF